jgi:type IX secretion system PorP/SprF family membrane protein
MRLLTLSIWIFLFPLYVCGQLYTISDHYVYNALAINPAYSGSQDALSTTVLYRTYWVGFEGSPKTMSLSIHAPLNNERVGLGFLIMNDNIGVSKETSFIGNYAYRMDLGYGKLAFGLGFGITFYSNAWNKLVAQDADDEQLTDNSSTGIMPNFSVGIYYTTKKYFMGLSVPLFLSHEFDSKTDKYIIRNDFTEYNYFYNAGYIFDIDPNIKFFPSLLVKYHQGNATQIDINSQVIIKNRVWLGVSYRSKNIIVGMLQCQINNQLRIAYSYDFNIGKYRQYNNGSHEIMLNYIFNYAAEVTNPRQF